MQGVFRTNPKNMQRAFVSVPELGIDVFVDTFRGQNRAMDGDQVLLELKSVKKWSRLAKENVDQTKNIEGEGYTNSTVIEKRVVDEEGIVVEEQVINESDGEMWDEEESDDQFKEEIKKMESRTYDKNKKKKVVVIFQRDLTEELKGTREERIAQIN